MSLIPLNSLAINFICMNNLPKNFTQALPDGHKEFQSTNHYICMCVCVCARACSINPVNIYWDTKHSIICVKTLEITAGSVLT